MKLKGLVALLLSSFALITGLVFGCNDDLREDKGELGPEADANVVLAAIENARGNKSVLEMDENEAVHYETNQKVEMGGTQLVMDQILKVYHRAESEDEIKIVLRSTTITYPDGPEGDPDIVNDELEPILIPKRQPTEEAPTLVSQSHPEMFTSRAVEVLSRGDFNTLSELRPMVDKVTIHNFRKQTYKKRPPAKVAKTPDCLGIPNCQLNVTEIRFDVAEWTNGDWKKVNFEMILTSEATFLSTDLQVCQGTLVHVASQQRDFYIRQCRMVRDFRFPRSETTN